MPVLYIISGCNGAGKTTAAKTILPDVLHCKEFVNADEIAKGLSPFNPENVAFQAARIMLERIDYLKEQGIDFAIETTLSTKSYVRLVEECQSLGYKVVLVFFWLSSVELALERVSIRVQKGGHNIPADVVERRYHKGLLNLQQYFLPIVDEFIVYNNTGNSPDIIASGLKSELPIVQNEILWRIIKS